MLTLRGYNHADHDGGIYVQVGLGLSPYRSGKNQNEWAQKQNL